MDPLTLYPSDEEMEESQLANFEDQRNPQSVSANEKGKKIRAAVDTNVFKVDLDLAREIEMAGGEFQRCK